MNALLVDDDRFVVAALEKKNKLGATNSHRSTHCFQYPSSSENHRKNSIDICVCDIEMPGGSGLDLLSWVGNQEKKYNLFS